MALALEECFEISILIMKLFITISQVLLISIGITLTFSTIAYIGDYLWKNNYISEWVLITSGMVLMISTILVAFIKMGSNN